MSKSLEQLAVEIESLRVAGVENKMFFGMAEICGLVFRNKIRLDLLRRWIEFADFPAPHLPKGKSRLRVTTWGLIEAWLMVLHEIEHEPGISRIVKSEASFRQRQRALTFLRRLHSGDQLDETIKEIEAQAESRIDRKIRQALNGYEIWLRKELEKRDDTSGDFKWFTSKARQAVLDARSAKGIRQRPVHGRSGPGST